MPAGARLLVLQGDITEQETDAIVNAANADLLGGGGVDGAIHRAAGPGLVAVCRGLPERSPGVRCPPGEARITPGFALKADWVIHTVGPVYGEAAAPAATLAASWRSSLALARVHGLQSIAFPAISCGVFGYPAEEAATVAMGVLARAVDGFREIRIVLWGRAMHARWLAVASRSLEAIP
ncbi:MAG: macro domain-containing protein [Myxococcota bacterium]|nr:macro domain-containing protein [Myxococcota bacterium]